MSPADATRLQLFLALFFMAVGFLFTLLCCGTDYWLLAAESCGGPGAGVGGALSGRKAHHINAPPPPSHMALDGGRIFHEGLFWRCWFPAGSHDFSVWDLWTPNQPVSKQCLAAFLFPFPETGLMDGRGFPVEPYERRSAIVFRTFWSIFLVVGLTAITAGGFAAVCAGPLASRTLFKVGGALQLCGGASLLLVLFLYLLWVQVLDTLEQWAHRRSLSGCPSLQLSVRHGPSFLLAPVAVFFCLLAGVLLLVVGRGVGRRGLGHKTSSASSI